MDAFEKEQMNDNEIQREDEKKEVILRLMKEHEAKRQASTVEFHLLFLMLFSLFGSFFLMGCFAVYLYQHFDQIPWLFYFEGLLTIAILSTFLAVIFTYHHYSDYSD